MNIFRGMYISVMKIAESISTEAWFIIGTVLAVLLILWLAKKALKLGIIMAIIVLIVTYVPGIISTQLDKYGISISSEGISVHNDDTDFDFDFGSISSISVVDRTAGGVKLKVVSKAGAKTIELSTGVYTVVKMIANSMDIEIVGDN